MEDKEIESVQLALRCSPAGKRESACADGNRWAALRSRERVRGAKPHQCTAVCPLFSGTVTCRGWKEQPSRSIELTVAAKTAVQPGMLKGMHRPRTSTPACTSASMTLQCPFAAAKWIGRAPDCRWEKEKTFQGHFVSRLLTLPLPASDRIIIWECLSYI